MAGQTKAKTTVKAESAAKKAISNKRKKPAKKVTSRRPAPAKKKAPVKRKAAVTKKTPVKSVENPSKANQVKDFDGNTSIRHLATLLGYSDATIRDHIQTKGGPVVSRGGSGKQATVNVKDWHKHFLNMAMGDGSSLSETKLAKQQEDLRRHKRENDEAEGKLVSIDEVITFYQGMLVLLSNKLDGIPGKAAGGDPVLRAKFLDEIRQSKSAIFSGIVEFLRPFVGSEQADLATATASELEMGSRETDSP